MMQGKRTLCCCLTLLLGATAWADIPTGLGFTGKRADRLENQRFEKRMWARPAASTLFDKRFPIKEWGKHYSPLGSKRAPIEMESRFEKKRFETKTLDRESVDFEMSRWNEKMADLHERAGIQMDEQAQIASKHQLYQRMMQNAEPYREMRPTLSLQEINRYQFRRNRADGPVPRRRAGSDAP